MHERVILVPGVGLAGAEMLLLAARLRLWDYRVSIFWHWTGKPRLEESARQLWHRCSVFREQKVHLVGHSLGGLVIVRMLADFPWDRAGRVITMGTPHTGFAAAGLLAGVPGARRFLWPGVLESAAGQPGSIPTGVELGVIAGTRNILFGTILARGQASDSLVGVGEAHHPAERARVTVAETHASMLVSGRVARHVRMFLREGRFDGDTP